MKESPLITVIVPVYRTKEYLSKCVESILTQSFTNFELLLINDGSPDNSGDICDDYALKDERVCVFHKENGGVSSARNLGLENAKGEYICFIDSDDWIEESFLMSYFLSDENNHYDLIFQGYTLNNKNSATVVCLPQQEWHQDEVGTCMALLHSNDLFGFTCNKLFRNSIIKCHSLRFDLRSSYMEDLLFTMEYCEYVRSILILPYALYHYRVLSTSLVRNPDQEKVLYTANAILNRIDKLPSLSANCEAQNVFRYFLASSLITSISSSYRSNHLVARRLRHTVLEIIFRESMGYTGIFKGNSAKIFRFCMCKRSVVLTDLILLIAYFPFRLYSWLRY